MAQINHDDGLPCTQTLLAGVLAATTAWAHCAMQPGGERRCRQLERRIVSGLYFLHRHPEVTGTLRELVTAMLGRWSDMASASRKADVPRGFAQGTPSGLGQVEHTM